MSKRTIQKFSPMTNEMLYEIPIACKSEVEDVCAKAADAFLSWKESSLIQRKKILSQFLEIIKENQERIVETIIKDTAKAYCEAVTEVVESCDIIEYYCDEEFVGIDQSIKSKLNEEMWPYKTAEIIYQPSGVFAVIKPWNYPFELSIWAIAPLLISGNSIVFKPSELSSATGQLLTELINKTDIPEGVFNLILGDSETGEYLVKNAKIRGISFTGSTSTGQKIYEYRKESFPKLSLEMGGSDYAVVFDSANLKKACSGILWGAFSNAGQVCVATEKVLISEKIYSDFLERLVRGVEELELGKEISPLISKKQFFHAMNVINLALCNGCKLIYGGKKADKLGFEKGNYLLPTIIECTNKEFLLQLPELFAPIIFVTPFAEEEDVISHINKSSFNLGCSLWTEEYTKHKEFIQNLNVGMIWVNEVNLPMPQVPWVGRKKSGIGVNLSKEAVYEAMDMKVIHVDNDVEEREWWYPYK